MSLDVTIHQKGLLRKTLPTAVILGNSLKCGTFDFAQRLVEGEPAPEADGFAAYTPTQLGRGICVTWNPREKRHVDLRLLTPTCTAEVREFFDVVKRIMGYWKAELVVEGEEMTLEAWQRTLGDYLAFNARALTTACEKILSGEEQTLTLFSAFWPVTMGEEEARTFQAAADPFAEFERWLHERQSVDAYYAAPQLFRVRDGEGEQTGTVGRYVFTENCRSIFPRVPGVPFGMIDGDTGKTPECHDFRVGLCATGGEGIIGELPYDEFLAKLPEGRTSRYDAKSLLIEDVSLSEMRAMLG